MDWISHDDRTLEDHLEGLKEVVDHILPEKTQKFFSTEDLKQQVYALIAYHDLAKTSIYFQLYLSNALVIKESGHKYYSVQELKAFLEKNSAKFEEWKMLPELKDHALFGAWMALGHFDNSHRYGLDALLFSKILKRHHGYLRDFKVASMSSGDKKEPLQLIGQNIDFDKYTEIVKEIGLPFSSEDIADILDQFKIRHLNKLVRKLKSNKDSEYYYKTLFLYSLLLSADKGDVMLQEKTFSRQDIKSDVIDKFKSKTLKTDFAINSLRNEAYNTAVAKAQELGENHFFSINLPTGLGKTFTAYKVALQIKEQFCPNFRIVYCLPFTSIIDQNASIFENILESAGINSKHIGVHHHLSVPNDIDKEESDSKYSEWEYFTEGWQNEITVTTFVQFWESIFGNHNRQIRKFHNLVNSVIILDEVQSINPDLFPALEFVMEELAKHFGTIFIFVTATQPILLKEKVIPLCNSGDEDYFFKKMDRTILDTGHLEEGSVSEENLAETIIACYKEDPCSTLVICNTIRFSQNLYEALSEEFEGNVLFYISAGIIPYSRKILLENEVKPRLENNEPIILISTQVVEAGVDIDFDIVYRDFAPLSSINQAAGRCNRNNVKGTSSVFLFRSGKERIYDPTQLDVTEKTLMMFDTKIPEDQFFELNQKFFKGIKDKIQDDSDVSNELIKSILSLRFENVGTNEKFRLFVEKYASHNFFIPINKDAKKLWNEYQQIFETEGHFKRKALIKLLMPKLMKYTVRIPDYIYQPRPDDLDSMLIYDEDWRSFYDKSFGYKVSEEKLLAIF